MKLCIMIFACLLCLGEAKKDKRYIFYDVNPGEGFNLRRDVFVRIAVMVKKLNLEGGKYDYILVLPPWGPLYHWQSRHLGEQIKIPWSRFFNVDSINQYVPVLDFEDYKKESGNVGSIIDVVYYLQNYKEGWTNGEFVEKIDFRDCLNQVPYQRDHENGKWKGPFWQYRQVRAKDFKCVSVQGTTRIMRDFIGKSANDDHKTIMLDRAETLLHDYFGDAEYWSVRRSMRFASHLTEISNDFRKDYLNSNDKDDNTNWPENWKNHKPSRGTAQGGPYICAHIRRKDYVYSRKDFIPNLKSAAEQLIRKCSDHNVKTVFIATDAPKEEFEELKTFMKDLKVFRYQPSTEVSTLYQDGGVAIIDQSVCSNAKYFIGSIESTFTFRIQEEREILGFNVEQSFDILCKTGEFDCKKGSVWKIAYPDANEYDIPHAEL